VERTERPIRQAASTEIMEVQVQIVPAGIADRAIVANLFQLYLYDFSETLGTTVEPNGLFAHPDISVYWTDAHRFPFLFDYKARPAGFALVGRGSVWSDDPEVFDVAEFFVLRGLRRKGIGRIAAEALFAQFPGSWDVRVLVNDRAALDFWTAVIQGSAKGPVKHGEWKDPSGLRHLVHRFTTVRAGAA
jgi:predicted acetyltransferase